MSDAVLKAPTHPRKNMMRFAEVHQDDQGKTSRPNWLKGESSVAGLHRRAIAKGTELQLTGFFGSSYSILRIDRIECNSI